MFLTYYKINSPPKHKHQKNNKLNSKPNLVTIQQTQKKQKPHKPPQEKPKKHHQTSLNIKPKTL